MFMPRHVMKLMSFSAAGLVDICHCLGSTARVTSLCLALVFATPAHADRRPIQSVEVDRFIQEMRERHGFEQEELVDLFAQTHLLPNVLEAISRPAEAKPWYEYRRIFLTPTRVDEGVEFWMSHRDILERAEETFGVPPEIIVAIIGVETLYGRYKGKIRVLDSLATLGFHYPRRSKFFRSELEQFLLLTREEEFDPVALRGSYAGAMGVPQFISSSYRRYAVDFDDDGIRDLLNNSADAIGSVANYLKLHGWKRGEDVVLSARVDGDGFRSLLGTGMKPDTRVGDMRKGGVDISADLPEDILGILLELETEDGPEYWVGLGNFYTITRYNHSALYAMAVNQLAETIRVQYLEQAER